MPWRVGTPGPRSIAALDQAGVRVPFTGRYCVARRLYRCVQVVALLVLTLFVAPSSRAEQEYRSPAAHLFSEESASEHWELTARFDSGHLLFAEFVITNIGFGDRNAVVFGHVVTPHGKSYRFTNGRTKSRWTLSPDRLRMEIGSSTLDLHAPWYRVQVDKRKVRLDIRFRPDATAVRADSLTPVGYTLEVLAAGVPVEGTLWLKGMAKPLAVRGSLTATHTWMKESGSTLVLRRIEIFSFAADASLYGIDLLTPRGARSRWVLIKPQGKSVSIVDHAELELQGEDKTTANPGYRVPQTLNLKSAGVEGLIQLDSFVLRADPLVDLPLPIRILVSVLLDFRPQRVWAPAEFSFAFQPADDGTPVRVQGPGVTAVSFLNPVPESFPVAVQHSE